MQIQCICVEPRHFGSFKFNHIRKNQHIQVPIEHADRLIHHMDSYNSNNSEWQHILLLLRQLSEQKRWIILIAPPKQLNIEIFNHYKINLNRILMVHPGTRDRVQLMEKALKSQSCSAVFNWGERLSTAQYQQLEHAASEGDTLACFFQSIRSWALSH